MSVASTKVGSSAKFGVAVFKASILNSLWGPSSRVDLSAKFGGAVINASILNSLGVHLPRSAGTTILHITPGKCESS